jgi:hypothetical protein
LAAETVAARDVADAWIFVEVEHYMFSGGAFDIDLGCCEEEWDHLDE